MILTYLTYNVLKHFPVKEANTEEEKNRIYKFRYQVYYNEFKMIEDSYNHQNKTLIDDLDSKENTILTYTESKNDISSVCRVHLTDKTTLSEENKSKYYLDDLPLSSTQSIAITERLAVHKSKRAKYLAVVQTSYVSNRLSRDLNTFFSFSSCSPGLLKYYMYLGYRPYTTEVIQFEDRIEIPIAVLPDMNFLKKVQSICYFPVKECCDNALKNSYENYRPDVLENYITSDKTIDNLDLRPSSKYKKSFLSCLKKDTINFLIKHCYFLNIKKGCLLYSEKEHHQERFIVLRGELFVSKAGTTIMTLHPGDITGELGISQDHYLRYVSVSVLEDCQLMVIPRGFERKLLAFSSSLFANFMESFVHSISNRERKLITKIISQKNRR